MTNSDEPETESEGEGGEDEESDEEQDFCDQFDDPPPMLKMSIKTLDWIWNIT